MSPGGKAPLTESHWDQAFPFALSQSMSLSHSTLVMRKG